MAAPIYRIIPAAAARFADKQIQEIRVPKHPDSGNESTKSTEARLEGFAEDLGKLLGTARAKAEGWLGQRQAIVEHLQGVRDTANQLLAQLGHQAEGIVRRGRPSGSGRRRPGRPAGATDANGIIIVSGKKRRKMSAKARAAISAAQKRRWARQKAAQK